MLYLSCKPENERTYRQKHQDCEIALVRIGIVLVTVSNRHLLTTRLENTFGVNATSLFLVLVVLVVGYEFKIASVLLLRTSVVPYRRDSDDAS